MTSHQCNKYEQITLSYLLCVKLDHNFPSLEGSSYRGSTALQKLTSDFNPKIISGRSLARGSSQAVSIPLLTTPNWKYDKFCLFSKSAKMIFNYLQVVALHTFCHHFCNSLPIESLVKVTGIRPMAPVQDRGPLEDI